jgi:hypothetical protein
MRARAAGWSSAVFGDGHGGQRTVAMTTGTLMGFMATGVILLAAIAGAIWLEGRMPRQPEQDLRPPQSWAPAAPGGRAGGQPMGKPGQISLGWLPNPRSAPQVSRRSTPP